MNRLNYFDDDKDFKFGNKGKFTYDEEETQQIQAKIGQIEDDSLASTQRALRMLNETEEIGNKTAQELVSQGEKLKNIDNQLDNINDNLNSTQKHINSIKSVFGGLKNRFFKGTSTKSIDVPKSDSSSSLAKTTSLKSSTSSQQMSQQQSTSRPADFGRITGSAREEEINKNLDEMSLGLSRLTNLAQEMQFELERQDPLINRLTPKMDITKSRIEDQNKQMKKVLK